MVGPVAHPGFTTAELMAAPMAGRTVVPRVRPMVGPVVHPGFTTAVRTAEPTAVRTVEPMAVRTVELMAAPTVAQTGLLATDARA
jgi:hypothetical protein